MVQHCLLGVICASTVALLTGCGVTYSLKEFAPTSSGPRSAFVDIKQRAVLSGNREVTQGQTKASSLIMCAEPSPDALSSLASEFALDAKYKDALQATLGYSQQEAASFVGLRTQTIQLLRDGMYRLCEGYLSGALSPADFAWLSRRYQRNMVALLTIEQLTRVVQVPVVAHASQGLASASRSATAIQADLEEIDKSKARLEEEKTKIESELKDAKALPDSDTSKASKVAEITKRLTDKEAALARAVEVRSALLEGLKSAKGILVSGTTTVQIVSDAKDGRSQVSEQVAAQISEITKKVLDQDDLPMLCFQILDGSRAGSNVNDQLKTACLALVNDHVKVQSVLLNQQVLNATLANTHEIKPGAFVISPLDPKVLRELFKAPSPGTVPSAPVKPESKPEEKK